MVAGLLFLAFAFFTVGKASAVRNGAQGAADAAALAAAQDARDRMGLKFLGALLLPNGLEDFFKGNKFTSGPACGEAQAFAAKNRSDVLSCDTRLGYLRDEINVKVKTRYTVGESVIPGTERDHATADATAVIEFRCTWKPEDKPDDSAPPNAEPPPAGDNPETPAPLKFNCDSREEFTIDPADADWAKLSKILFAVHLVD